MKRREFAAKGAGAVLGGLLLPAGVSAQGTPTEGKHFVLLTSGSKLF